MPTAKITTTALFYLYNFIDINLSIGVTVAKYVLTHTCTLYICHFLQRTQRTLWVTWPRDQSPRGQSPTQVGPPPHHPRWYGREAVLYPYQSPQVNQGSLQVCLYMCIIIHYSITHCTLYNLQQFVCILIAHKVSVSPWHVQEWCCTTLLLAFSFDVV